ncbi:DUF2569 domain-containing protein [Phocoenobacter skyensis]|uniref:DUF2569 domain-containing protein n=1 Tax=Phocoenobacter skyensis TaxID=97481 RepID=A0A1H7VDM6_9PAST|nr:DUF2569 domain-containing protein [Pasteurella skyensis]MDP8079373.1 DUF2569 domain-containing protein [Pasteurella skyensis]MDP8085245.1 DUF2569 domain-containing protein [Pasteurella skyensis]MDP8171665.1 DUF2569 domain-containing protein [Pasteurella skyensis]MDP8175818.1 DUF2569 domain-containing protein [Pasteurella skyensis]MDP8184304.1 DUF2569 domain-containing protein [Pasteurella skyensis]
MLVDIPEKEHKGWFILLGTSILFAPFQILAELFPIYELIFENEFWEELITVNSPYYVPHLKYFVICELVCNILILLAWIYLAYLFFTKHYKFPKLFVIISLASLLFIIVDTSVEYLVFKDVLISVVRGDIAIRIMTIYCLIWITYVRKSVRVKNTFVKKKGSTKKECG